MQLIFGDEMNNMKLKIFLFIIYSALVLLVLHSSISLFTSVTQELKFIIITISLALLYKFLNSDIIKDIHSSGSVLFSIVLPIFIPAIIFLPTHQAILCVALSSYMVLKKEIAFHKRLFNISSLGIAAYLTSITINHFELDVSQQLYEPTFFLLIILTGVIFNLTNSILVYFAISIEKNKFDVNTFLAIMSTIKTIAGSLFLAVINVVVFAYANVIGVAITSFIFVFLKPALTYHQIFNNELIVYTNFVLGLLKKKDPITHLHSERVKYWTVMLAKQMKMSKHDIRDLSLAASWHDIGKIDLPEDLLTKPGRLTVEEYDLIKTHPEVGYEMVKDIHFFKKFLPVIRHHHESYDGSGYPLGLKNNEITLHARIMCITDSFDAMTADRPYRSGMHMRDAVAELIRCKQKQFDPKLVDVFIEALKKNFGNEFERWDEEKEKILSAS